MTATKGTPTSAEVIRLAIEARMARVNVSLPGRVESYDSATQTADVRPMLKRVLPSGASDTEDILEELPVIPSVPVLHYRGKGFYLHTPLEPGDTVLLVFNDLDPSQWRRTGEVSSPSDQRPHSLAHAVAIPGYATELEPIADASSSNMTLGKDGAFQIVITPTRVEVGGNSDAAALASKVKTLEAALISHKHPETGGTTLVSVELAPPAYTPQTFDSDVLKVGS